MSAVKVHLYDDATLKSSPVVSGGAWSVSALALAEGNHILKGRAEDAAGNLSGYSAVKRIITGCDDLPDVDLIDDTGQSSVDNITNNYNATVQARLTLPIPTGASSVSTQSVSAIKFYEKTGASTYAFITTDNAPERDGADFVGTFDFQGQADGVIEVCATWVDAQGNESAKGTALAITIDTTAPDAPAITNIQDGQVFVGTSIDVSGSAS
jgi:hypothetical protein